MENENKSIDQGSTNDKHKKDNDNSNSKVDEEIKVQSKDDKEIKAEIEKPNGVIDEIEKEIAEEKEQSKDKVKDEKEQQPQQQESIEKSKAKLKPIEILYNLDSLCQLLQQLKFISKPFSVNQTKCLEYLLDEEASSSSQIKGHFTFTSSISTINFNIQGLYSLFKSFEFNQLYGFEDFKLLIQIFSSIYSAFNDDLFRFDLSKDLFNINDQSKVVILSFIDNDIKQTYSDTVNKVYQILSTISDIPIKNILILLSIFTLFGDISYRTFSEENYLRHLNAYNKIVISDFKLFLLIHIHLIVLLNFTVRKHKPNDQPNQSKSKGKEYNDVILSIFYLDNYTDDHLLQPNFRNIIMSSTLKLYLLDYLNQSNMRVKLNVNVLSFDSIKYIYYNLNALQGQLIIPNNTILSLDKVLCIFDRFFINDFNIQFNYSFCMDVISAILSAYYPIIISSKSFTANSECITNHIDNNNDIKLLSYADYLSELDMILTVLRFNYRLKEAKNKSKSLYKTHQFNFNFNSFAILTQKDLTDDNKHIRNIVITFNQQLFKEEDFLEAFAQQDGFINYYSAMRKIFSELQHFRKYIIGVRLNQYPIKNKQLEYYFGLMSLLMQYYLNDHTNSHKNVIIAETDFINLRMTLYINNTFKQKEKMSHYIRFSSSSKYEGDFANCFNPYMSSLIELCGEILISTIPVKKGKFNPNVLLRAFTENTIMLIKQESTESNHIIVYLHEGENKICNHSKIMEVIEKIKQCLPISNQIKSIKVVMRIECFQGGYDILKSILPIVNTIYIINNQFDLVLQEKRIVIHHNDVKATESQLEIFWSIMTKCYNCLEFIIDNQLRIYNNVSYIMNNKWVIQLKNGSLNIKKITLKSYESVFDSNLLNKDNSYSVAQIITDKTINNDYSIANMIKLFKENKSKEELNDIIHNDFLKEKYNKMTLVLFKTKLYSLIKKLLPKSSFEHLRVFPIKVNPQNSKDNEIKFNEKDVALFKIDDNSKIGFYSKNDIGALFSISNTEKILETFMSNGKLQNDNEGSNVKLYLVKYEDLSNEIKMNKQNKLKEKKDNGNKEEEGNKELPQVKDQIEAEEKSKGKEEEVKNSKEKDKKQSNKEKCNIF